MKHRIISSVVFPLLLALALVLSGCGSIHFGAKNRTLKQTQMDISWPMTHYLIAAGFGALTLAERERINTAYPAYQAAFDQALQEAGGNYDAPSPDYLKVRANQLIVVLSGIPMVR